MYSFCAMYSFKMSFCSVPLTLLQSTPRFAPARAGAGNADWCPRPNRSPRIDAWSTSGRDTSMDECRGCKVALRDRRVRAQGPILRDHLACKDARLGVRKSL